MKDIIDVSQLETPMLNSILEKINEELKEITNKEELTTSDHNLLQQLFLLGDSITDEVEKRGIKP